MRLSCKAGATTDGGSGAIAVYGTLRGTKVNAMRDFHVLIKIRCDLEFWYMCGDFLRYGWVPIQIIFPLKSYVILLYLEGQKSKRELGPTPTKSTYKLVFSYTHTHFIFFGLSSVPCSLSLSLCTFLSSPRSRTPQGWLHHQLWQAITSGDLSLHWIPPCKVQTKKFSFSPS